MWPNPLFPTDLVTFTVETLNAKLHFLCNVNIKYMLPAKLNIFPVLKTKRYS